MATLYGKTYTRAELLQRVGDVRQLGGVRLKTLSDGERARGARGRRVDRQRLSF